MPTVEVEIDEDIFLPVYQHLLEDSDVYDIEFLYGGRDSGKSRHVAMQVVTDCINSKYFKCLLIRKVQNTVRSSQFDLIKSILQEWNISAYFSFNESRLEIIYRENGNGFFGRGLDDVGRIKSFNNPSCCWIEEGNQITSDDFVVILTSLRANQKVKTYFTFNPECEGTYTDFWLYQDYFEHTELLSFTWQKIIDTPKGPVDFNIRATHSTYRDNPYCSAQRMALYESYRTSKNNAYWYQTYTLGLWGYRKTGGEFWKCFDRQIHVKSIDFDQPSIHVVVDNNRNPYIAVSLWQINMQEKRIEEVDELPCAHPNNTAMKAGKAVAKWLDRKEYNGRVFLYGDPSANAKSTVDDEGRSFFDKFKEAITSENYKIEDRIGKSAPGVAISGEFVNEIYESNFLGWTINISDKCIKSIEDYTMVKEDMDGTMMKKKETNKDTKVSFERYGHFSDGKRYFIVSILKNEFEKYKGRKKSTLKSVASHLQ